MSAATHALSPVGLQATPHLPAGELEAVRLAREAGFAEGVAEGRRRLALEVSVALKQFGLDLVAAQRRDARGEVLVGNISGVGSLAELEAPQGRRAGAACGPLEGPGLQPEVDGPPGPSPQAPPLPPPEPVPAAERPGGRGYRTPERLAVLQRDWPRGRPADLIADEMDRLPGPLVNRANLAIWAYQANLARPAGSSRHTKWSEPVPAPPPAAISAPDDLPPPRIGWVPADARTIRAWAEAHGLRYRTGDVTSLAAINRVRAGQVPPLAPFRLA
jgi:hypothetical protein